MSLRTPDFELPPHGVSKRVFKATTEIHHNVDPTEYAAGQIVLRDLVFAIDSITSAAGMTGDVLIMVAGGFGFHFPKGYIYAAMVFSGAVEGSTCSPDAGANNRRNEMAEGGNPSLTDDGAAIAEILLPVAIDRPYSYLVPRGIAVAPGDFVEVPLGTRMTNGVVWEVRSGAGGAILKAILTRLDIPPLPAKLRKFIDWVARWTLSPRGMVLRMAIRAPFQAGQEPARFGVRLKGPPPPRMTSARARVIAAAEGGLAFSKAALAEAAACSSGVIDNLIGEGTLETIALPPEPVALACDPAFARPSLEAAQENAASILADRVQARAFSVTLLEGVTGSGKTEVYFEAVAAALEAGRQSLILMPEIALTAQFLDRFAARFGARPGEWHSGVSARKRARLWHAVAEGNVKAVIGARSALFLPFADLAALIVDEEHESAYKQEDGVAYHARDMAVVRGQIEKSAVVLVSATASIESRVNAGQGRYGHIRLAARFKAKALPAIAAIDLRTEARAGQMDRSPPHCRDGGGARAWRTGTAVSQPAGLRAFDPLPRVRTSFQLPELHRLACRTPFPAGADVPSLRPYRTKAHDLPGLRGGQFARRLRPRHREIGRGSGEPFSAGEDSRPFLGYSRRHGASARGNRNDLARRMRYRHRHPACRQGT